MIENYTENIDTLNEENTDWRNEMNMELFRKYTTHEERKELLEKEPATLNISESDLKEIKEAMVGKLQELA